MTDLRLYQSHGNPPLCVPFSGPGGPCAESRFHVPPRQLFAARRPFLPFFARGAGLGHCSENARQVSGQPSVLVGDGVSYFSHYRRGWEPLLSFPLALRASADVCNPCPHQAKTTGSEILTNIFQPQQIHTVKYVIIITLYGSLQYV
jgi:hypothetical protein